MTKCAYEQPDRQIWAKPALDKAFDAVPGGEIYSRRTIGLCEDIIRIDELHD
jgi:hypothetical protein